MPVRARSVAPLWIAALVPLAACVDLSVVDVSTEWRGDARTVRATVQGAVGADSRTATVRFELEAARQGAARVFRDETVVLTNASPQKVVVADFAPVARSDRYGLEGYSTVRVTVDPDRVSPDPDRSNNVRTAPLPLVSGTPGLVPTPAPLESSGDALYATYRRGLIQRHIARNGRFMQVVSLRPVPRFDPSSPEDFWSKLPDGRIPVPHSAGSYFVPAENARYSWEAEAECSSEVCPEASLHLWVPLLAPLKNPGATNDVRWVLAADGDNPNYYGGMALALFSLEAKHGVSPHSLAYARKLVEFMVRSEIPASGGYVARRAHHFLTTPTLRGGSAEELIGIFLGLEFYLQVEDARHPLRAKALALREGIFEAVNSAPWVDVDWSSVLDGNWKGAFSKSAAYVHPYFTNTYPAKHLLFAMLAALGRGTSETRWADARTVFTEQYNEYYLGCSSGCSYWQIAEMAALMLVVLESPLSNADKRDYALTCERWLAEVVSREGADATHNGLLAVTADAVQKVLQGRVAGDDSFSRGRALVTNPVASGRSTDAAELLWNHDLPLSPGPGGRDYNPPVSAAGQAARRIGSEFIWLDRLPMVMSPGTHLDSCPFALPGWPEDDKCDDYAGNIGSAERWFSAAAYAASPSKAYSATGYAQKELAALDIQFEGAGLDLLFPRMLLTELDPSRYPPPVVSDGLLPVLPFDGPGILPPAESLEAVEHSFAGVGVRYEDRKTLSIVSVPPGYVVGAVVGGGFQTVPNLIALNAWKPEGGAAPRLIGTTGVVSGAKAVLAPLGPNRFALVTRSTWAEGGAYWLEVSHWAVDDRGLRQLARWSGQRNQRAVPDIAAAVIDSSTLAVSMRGWDPDEPNDWLRVFRLSDTGIESLVRNDKYSLGPAPGDDDLVILSSRGGFIHYPVRGGGLTRFATLQWDPAAQTFRSVGTTDQIFASLVAAAVVSTPGGGPQHLVAAFKEPYVGYQLALHAWTIDEATGALTYGGVWKGETGDTQLLTREQDWSWGRMASRESPFGPWFVLAGKAPVLRSAAASGGTGMKLLHGRVLPGGAPTVEGMAVAGEGIGDMPFDLAVTGDPHSGVFSLHLGATATDFGNKRVHLIQWAPRDEHRCILRCEEIGAQCGDVDDGCGGTVACPGACSGYETCGGGGLAHACGCTTQCAGRCGGPDGCGGTCPDVCGGYETCGGGGVANACGCTTQCAGRCGGADGCGGTCADTCTGYETCGGGGVAGACGCTPLTDCSGLCGTHRNGCGGVLECGGCPPASGVELVSVDSAGVQAAGHSSAPDISADGRLVVFASLARNLVAGDTNGSGRAYDNDVFVHDRQTGATTRVNVSTSGAQDDAYALAVSMDDAPVISADGRVVAFTSQGNTLAACLNDGATDVFVHDLQTGVTELVSIQPDGGEFSDSVMHPSLSADGRFVAFSRSPRVNVHAGGAYVRDRLTGVTTVESVAPDGSVAGGSFATISGDGSAVAFTSTSALDPDHPPLAASWHVYVRDRGAGRTTLVSRSTLGATADTGGSSPALSTDGRFVAFVSGAANLVPGDTNRATDVFVHDRATGQTTRVSVASDGTQANAASARPRISGDGRFVVFQSAATNLVPGDSNALSDVFIHDRLTAETRRVSVSDAGVEGNSLSSSGAISANGGFVVLVSEASNLVPIDTNACSDVFVRPRP